MNELISIICTVKNGEKTLPDTIDSVLFQTYRNIEFIIIDDGSSDGTKAIIESYAKEDSRIKPFYSPGMGRSKALNKAIELSEGQFIANIDADDLMQSQKTEIQVKFFLENPSFFLVSTDFEVVYDNESVDWQKINQNSIEASKVDNKLLIKNNINHSAVMMNKQHLNSVGNYNEEQLTQVDYELWLRAFTQNKEMAIINEKLVAKRIHETQSFENKKRLRYTFNSMKLQLRYILKNSSYVYLLPIPVMVFLFAQLPYSVRSKINKVLNTK